MKKVVVVAGVVLLGATLGGCAYPEILDGVQYSPYGIANENVVKSDKVCYEMSAGSVIFGIIFVETIIAPVYIVGWNLMQPVRFKRSPDEKC